MTMADNGGSGSPSGVADQIRESGSQIAGQAAEQAGRIVDQAKPQLEHQKERVAGSIGSAADALRQTSSDLRGTQDTEMVAQAFERAAGGADQFAGYLRSHTLDDLVRDVEGFARRSPGVFMSGAFGLGLLAARFLKSSGGASQSRGMGSGGRGYRDARGFNGDRSSAPYGGTSDGSARSGSSHLPAQSETGAP